MYVDVKIVRRKTKNKWGNLMASDTRKVKKIEEDVGDRVKCRCRTRVAYP